MSARDRGIPWEQCRGIKSIDLNDNLILVKAPIEQVAQSFKQVRQVARWEHDVYGRSIEILGCTFVVFQCRICKSQCRGHHKTQCQTLLRRDRPQLYSSPPRNQQIGG